MSSYYTPTEEEVLALLNKPDIRTLKGIRDQAILELLYASGLRRRELVDLNVDSINIQDQTVRVVKGKGNKDRFIPITKKAAQALSLYLQKARPMYNRNPNNKALFLADYGGTRLCAAMITSIIRQYALTINPKICTYSLRHAVATHMLRRGADIIYIQKLLGHNQPSTTQIYTRLYPKDLIELYRRFHPRTRPLGREPLS